LYSRLLKAAKACARNPFDNQALDIIVTFQSRVYTMGNEKGYWERDLVQGVEGA